MALLYLTRDYQQSFMAIKTFIIPSQQISSKTFNSPSLLPTIDQSLNQALSHSITLNNLPAKITFQILCYVGQILKLTYIQPLTNIANQQPIINHQSSIVANSRAI